MQMIFFKITLGVRKSLSELNKARHFNLFLYSGLSKIVCTFIYVAACSIAYAKFC